MSNRMSLPTHTRGESEQYSAMVTAAIIPWHLALPDTGRKSALPILPPIPPTEASTRTVTGAWWGSQTHPLWSEVLEISGCYLAAFGSLHPRVAVVRVTNNVVDTSQ